MFFALPAVAELAPWQSCVDEARFAALAVELAPRVDLFEAIWKIDRKARLYGGTSRDFLWFLRREFSRCRQLETCETCISAVVEKLRHRTIGIDEFVVGESDVDVITAKDLLAVKFDGALITRLEVTNPGWFRPGDSRYRQERAQGGLPVEKIQLGLEGFVDPSDPDLAGGVGEIYRGRPTMVFKETIRDTEMYKKRGNHPLLLALRYVRQAGIAYSQLHGRKPPSAAAMLRTLDEASLAAARTILAEIRRDPAALSPFFADPDFLKRVNKVVRKIFRSYTNPAAAKRLFDALDLGRLLEMYPGIQPYQNIMFARFDDDAAVAEARAKYPRLASRIETVGAYLKRHGIPLRERADGSFVAEFFHGTTDMAAYRGIVFQGILASEGGSAGAGVYLVDRRNYDFAKNWKKEAWDSSERFVVRLEVDPSATIIDLVEAATYASDEIASFRLDTEGRGYDRFAAMLGLDLVRYPYAKTHAYVLTSATHLRGTAGETVPIMPLPEMQGYVAANAANPDKLQKLFEVDPKAVERFDFLIELLPIDQQLKIARALAPTAPAEFLHWFTHHETELRKHFGAHADRKLNAAIASIGAEHFRLPKGTRAVTRRTDAAFDRALRALLKLADRYNVEPVLFGRPESQPPDKVDHADRRIVELLADDPAAALAVVRGARARQHLSDLLDRVTPRPELYLLLLSAAEEAGYLSRVAIAKRLPDGFPARVIEVVSRSNKFVPDNVSIAPGYEKLFAKMLRYCGSKSTDPEWIRQLADGISGYTYRYSSDRIEVLFELGARVPTIAKSLFALLDELDVKDAFTAEDARKGLRKFLDVHPMVSASERPRVAWDQFDALTIFFFCDQYGHLATANEWAQSVEALSRSASGYSAPMRARMVFALLAGASPGLTEEGYTWAKALKGLSPLDTEDVRRAFAVLPLKAREFSDVAWALPKLAKARPEWKAAVDAQVQRNADQFSQAARQHLRQQRRDQPIRNWDGGSAVLTYLTMPPAQRLSFAAMASDPDFAPHIANLLMMPSRIRPDAYPKKNLWKDIDAALAVVAEQPASIDLWNQAYGWPELTEFIRQNVPDRAKWKSIQRWLQAPAVAERPHILTAVAAELMAWSGRPPKAFHGFMRSLPWDDLLPLGDLFRKAQRECAYYLARES